MRLFKVASLALVSGALITGCSTSGSKSPSNNAWDAYQTFQRELNQNSNQPAYAHYLSDDWIAMFDVAESEEEKAELQHYAAYPEWLTEPQAHYEKPSGDGLCLSVNGTAYDQSPGTVAVRYVRENSRLKAAEIHYQYWGNKEEFPHEAKCPEDFELEFPST